MEQEHEARKVEARAGPDAAADPTHASPPSPPAPTLPPPIGLEVLYDPCVNYAMQQNAVPVVKGIRIGNKSARHLEDVRVVLWAEPDLIARHEIRIEAIAPESVYNLDQVRLALSAEKLAGQTEREEGLLHVEILEGETRLLEEALPLHVLAYSEWAGSRSLPEVLAAFVTPNHPVVEAFLKRVREPLAAHTSSPALQGYQAKDPKRVREIWRAIYETACGLGLTYINPPASFEHGQKIRTPERLVEAEMGTCLDLACFLASAAEQAGLHPLIVFTKGHAFAAVWTEETTFPDPVVDQVLKVRKRIDLGEIIPLEATAITNHPSPAFEDAVKAGRAHLDQAEAFTYVVDIKAARKRGIRPIPSRVKTEGHEVLPQGAGGIRPPTAGAVVARLAEDARPLPEPLPDALPAEDDGDLAPAPKVAAPARLEKWKRKLLDLSLRNRLLNFRVTASALPLLCPDVGRLEDLLAQGQEVAVHPRPEGMGKGDPRDPEVLRLEGGPDPLQAALEDGLDAGRLHVDATDTDLDRRLVKIDRAARLSLEEGGANILYLAIGFLHWYESPSSEKERRAPILLLPLELKRTSVLEGYRISLLDEDPRANVSLFQKLRADFDIRIEGLDDLDTDDTGLDVAKILDRVRKAVLPMDRWEVREEACISLFSFTKYLMWLDLEKRADRLCEAAVVKHLVETPTEPFAGRSDLPRPEDIDETMDPAQTFCPLDADSSQLAAVSAATDGTTFVLQGPPGTGKSQTITNLIAQSLATGKRVLFVSAKMAALNVVHKRLQHVGLGPFCLEIHSNKAQKSKVLAQIGEALSFHADAEADAWERSAVRLKGLRGELNAYARTLHQPRAFGQSAFQGFSTLARLRDTPRVTLDLGEADAVDATRLQAMREAVTNLHAALEDVGAPNENPWRGAAVDAWSPASTGEIRTLADRVVAHADEAGDAAEALGQGLALDGKRASEHRLAILLGAGDLLAASPSPTRALVEEPDGEAIAARVAGWTTSIRRVQALRTTLDEVFDDGLYDDPHLPDLKRRIDAALRTFWPLSWLKGLGPRGDLKPFAHNGKLPKTKALPRLLEDAAEVRTLQAALARDDEEARRLLGRYWDGRKTDADRLEKLVAWTGDVRGLLRRATFDAPESLPALRAHWLDMATDGRAALAEGAPLRQQLETLRTAGLKLAEARARLDEVLSLDAATTWGRPETAGTLERARELSRRWQDGLPILREWCSYQRACQSAEAQELGPLLEAINEGSVDVATLEDAFEHSFHHWWIGRIVEAEPLLRDFNRAQQENRVRKFRNLDIHMTEEAHAMVQARVAAGMPRGNHAISSQSSSEMGILQRELMKQRRHMPIRKLFKRIPNVIQRLKPCMLMSPLSVAQYLNVDFPPFDLVVFDEASQIPVWDAIGAAARGKDLVVVGDPKQLPPTSFFQRSDDEEPDEDDIEELESILDECMGARLPVLSLNWHYRSRHESLIAFSNYHYYGNKLLTFPAARLAGDTLGVSFRYFEAGIYDRGKSRANRVEAEAVVAEIVARLQDPKWRHRSIGVVTFSIAQQTLIEDLLDKARRDRPEIDGFFGSEVEEPVFVKNLENVQGDERDVILFSVCYGPDLRGRIALNFGPLNRDGGQRRLNVAITRARRQVIVFASLRADHIDLARTNAQGVRHLKAFLEYAEKGESVLGQALQVQGDATWDSVFEQQVDEALTARGWEVQPQVGCSGYRVDLGIKDPEDPGRYLLGVECDGASYHSGKTARDRDRLRAAVLEGLGWHLHRVWSTDWWINPEREIEKILLRLEELKAKGDGAPEAGEAPRDEDADLDDADTLFPTTKHVAAPPTTARADPTSPTQEEVLQVQGARPYVEVGPGGPISTPEAFYMHQASKAIDREIRHVVDVEGPIAYSLLARRVAARWDIHRVTKRVRERLSQRLHELDLKRTYGLSQEFFWKAEQDPKAHEGFRARFDGRDPPWKPEEVPTKEILNAACAVLQDQVSMTPEDLARETARVLGFQRLGKSVKEHMDHAIQTLVETGCATRGEDGLLLATSR